MIRAANNVCRQGTARSDLAQVFHPICVDLQSVQEHLARTFQDTRDPAVRGIVDFLLASPGKRIRPALVLLSARAARTPENGSSRFLQVCTNVAAAVEIVHMASLVHDDLIDAAMVRHGCASIPAQWGKRVAAALGDSLCAKAFRLVADCADPRLFGIVGSSLSDMCEGELLGVIGRGGFRLPERYCLAVIERKTAALFGACCAAGALVAACEPTLGRALQRFGLHIGVAFQILDDCKDLLGDREELGKVPGQDWLVGDVTLPLLYVIDQLQGCSDDLLRLGRREPGEQDLARVGQAFRSSPARERIAELIDFHIGQARRQLHTLADSVFKDSLCRLASHIATSASCLLTG